MVSDIFTYVATSVLIALSCVGVLVIIYLYFRRTNSKLIEKIEKDIAASEWSNNVRIAHLRGVSRVAEADHFAADMTRAKEEFCEEIRLASHDDKTRLASHTSYFRQLIDISTKIKAAPPVAVQHYIPQRELIRPPRRTDKYQILANGEGMRPPASVASTHASAAVENVRRPNTQIAAVEGGTSPAVEATARVPAAAEREDVGSATTGGSIHLTTLRSTRSQDGDSAYFSIESSNTPTE